MTPVTFYSKNAAFYAYYAVNDGAYANATYATYAADAADAAAYYAAYYADAAVYDTLKDLGVKYAGVLVQCQIIILHQPTYLT